MEFLAKWCPKLSLLYLGSGQALEHQVDYEAPNEFDFDDSGMCIVTCGCRFLLDVDLSGRLHVGGCRSLLPCKIKQNFITFRINNNIIFEAITGEGLRAFAHHPTLETLKIFSCHNMSWEDVVSVGSTCMSLKRLGLSGRM
ncbi:leucine-rich repeat, cysteine-containing subtype protein, partial [Tanacetum coccineum]